jgi:phosphatidylinositol-bisphosphatase
MLGRLGQKFANPNIGSSNQVGDGAEPDVPRYHPSPERKLGIPALLSDTKGEVIEDGRSYNPVVMSYIREDWIKKQMKDREKEFTETQMIRVNVCTWNVNGKKPSPDLDLAEWLQLPNETEMPEVFALGFQEMVDLTAVNVASDNKTAKSTGLWIEKFDAALARMSGVKYRNVERKYLVGLMMVVYVKEDVMPHVKGVQSCAAGVGVLGMLGNKGGVSIRLQIYDSTICFVCSHLAAHRENVAGRNSDFYNIISKTVFKDEMSQAFGGQPQMELEEESTKGPLEHDYVVWFGDLNYRIVDEVSTEAVFQRIASDDLQFLSDRDQLNVERKEGRVFKDFEEGDVTNFKPTYKYQPGTDLYEQRPEKKLRAPAWCDRVLWRCRTSTDSVELLHYGASKLLMSDHKPVRAGMKMQVKKIIKDKQKQVNHGIIRLLDTFENECIPKVFFLIIYILIILSIERVHPPRCLLITRRLTSVRCGTVSISATRSRSRMSARWWPISE